MKHIKRGSGDYLVLVHGALADGSIWREHMQHLAADFEIVAVTLRHFSGPDEEGGFGLNSHADELAELLRQLLADKPVHAVGWSYGADVVLNALVRHDLPVAKAFLYEPGFPGYLQWQDMLDWQADAQAMFGPVFEHFASGNLPLAVEALIDGSGKRPGYFRSQPDAVREAQLAKAYTLAHQLNQQEQPEIDPARLAAIDVPLVCAYGQDTRDLFRLVTRGVAQLAGRAELMEIAGANHMLPQENPQAFSRHIRNHLLRGHPQMESQ